jgi:maleate isomerase
VAISSSWRGSVGIIKPTMRLGGIEEFIRLLPEGIGVLPLFVNIRKGTADEFKSVLDHFEEHVKTLASVPVELIHPEGAPPFMVHGLAGERDIVQRWERAYGVPIVTAPQTQVEAMRALGIRRIVGVSYFRGDFDRAQNLSSHEVYSHTRKTFLDNPGADGIYMLGSGWKVTDIVQLMEDDFGVPVVHAQMARLWAIQNRLHVREPRRGYGRLLSEHPEPVEVALAT